MKKISFLFSVVAFIFIFSEGSTESSNSSQTTTQNCGMLVKFRQIDDKSILITEGFDYRWNMKIGYDNVLVIDEVDKGVFSSRGMSFIPLCMESDESKQRRKKSKDEGTLGFEPLVDVVGTKWIFAKHGISFEIDGCTFRSIQKEATIEFKPKSEGILIKGVELVSSAADEKMVTLFRPLYANIFEAIFIGDEQAVRKFLNSDSSMIKAENNIGMKPLHVASLNGQLNIVRLLVGRGAFINSHTDNIASGNVTPLHSATYNGHKEVVKFLISKGADLNAKDVNGATPLILASFRGQVQVVELLLSKGANINMMDEKYGATALLWAVGAGQKAVVKLLVQKGADITIQDSKGQTPLDEALKTKNDDLIRLLRPNEQ